MRGFSKAILTGNLTRDPEVRTTPNGANVCSFTVAVNRTYRATDGQNREEVSFIDCVAWGKPGEIIAQYAKKGSGILVSGRLSQRSWEDKNGGGRRSRTEVVVDDFIFTGGGSRQDNGAGSDSGSAFGAPIPSIATNTPAGSSGASAQSMPDFPNDIPEDIPEGEIDVSEIPF